MKNFFCKECGGILPKGKIICSKCGYDNPELIPALHEHIRRQIIIRRIICGACVVALVVFLHVNLLFPWQWRALCNKTAAIEYVKKSYPNARLIESDYESTEFNPWRTAMDRFCFGWNGVKFYIIVEQGEISYDFYWHGVARKIIDENYIAPFLETRKVSSDYELHCSELEEFLRKNDPVTDISQFNGHIEIRMLPHYDDKKTTPKSLGWLYDFYCYCNENIDLPDYIVNIVYNGRRIKFTQATSFQDEAEFYSSFRDN